MLEDERYKQILAEKENALNQSNNTYNELINNNQTLYDEQKQYADTWEQTQNDILNKQLEFNTSEIEKQKEKADKSYQNEAIASKNAYYDYVNPYGANAEVQATNGLQGSGFSETNKSMAWQTQQNRTAQARTALQNAIQEYDSDINQARLNYDTNLAQNALTKLQMTMDYLTQYYGNLGDLKLNQLNTNQNLDNTYYGRSQDLQSQLNTESAMAYQKQQDALAQANWQKEYSLAKQQTSNSGSGSSLTNGSGSGGSSSNLTGTTSSNGLTIAANPYTGTVNADAKNGVFEWSENKGSGYQPNNVGGQQLSKSGYKVSDIFGSTAYGTGGVSLSNQSIWSVNGKYYVWDGSLNDYIDVSSQVKMVSSKKGSTATWGF